jgi:hypothetical protein
MQRYMRLLGAFLLASILVNPGLLIAQARQQQARQQQPGQSDAQAQNQARAAQQQAMHNQQDQARRAQMQQVQALQQQRNAQEQSLRTQEQAARVAQQQAMQNQRTQRAQQAPQLQQAQQRSFQARNAVPLQKAVSMPIAGAGIPPEQQKHAQQAANNLRTHLSAVPMSAAPSNMMAVRNRQMSNYLNNGAAEINGQRLQINRENTMFNQVGPSAWPYWYHAQPGWVYSDGFVLGSLIQVGLNWLQWGWHPYYGPPPSGFICASDYVPTPWVYIPAYGLWRQPGVMSYSPAGPGPEYTQPITVEAFEPLQLQIRDPFTGFVQAQPENTVYLYDAYYYPDQGRWGYTNHHGYFVWVNV